MYIHAISMFDEISDFLLCRGYATASNPVRGDHRVEVSRFQGLFEYVRAHLGM
jgi:hypothetical protein